MILHSVELRGLLTQSILTTIAHGVDNAHRGFQCLGAGLRCSWDDREHAGR